LKKSLNGKQISKEGVCWKEKEREKADQFKSPAGEEA
jgi:hypothetical protein